TVDKLNIKESTTAEFTKEKKDIENKLENLEEEILLFAQDNFRHLEGALFAAGKREELSMPVLMRLFVRGEAWEYFKLSGIKDPNVIQELESKLTGFLLLKSRLAHVKRTIDCFGDYNNATTDEQRKDILAEIGENLSASRYYSPYALEEDSAQELLFKRAALFFEAETGFLLREEQVNTLKELLSTTPEGNYQNLVKQMIMGGGKSKVLMPLLALCKARGDNLCAVMVPNALYETNLADLTDTSSSLFGQKTFSFQFSRFIQYTPSDLRKLRTRLESCKAERSYLVLDETTVSSVMLTYYEKSLKLERYAELIASPNLTREEIRELKKLGTLKGEVEELGKILAIFKDSGDLLIDEIDTVLDCKKQLNYPFGEDKDVIPKSELRLINHIYKCLGSIEITSSGKQIRIKDLLARNGQATLPSLESIKSDLIEKISTRPLSLSLTDKPKSLKDRLTQLCSIEKIGSLKKELQEHIDSSTLDRQHPLHYMLENIKDLERDPSLGKTPLNLASTALDKEIKSYLSGNRSQLLFSLLEFFKEQDGEFSDIANLFALSKQEITSLLENSLNKSNNEGYGIDPSSSSPQVIPFEGANTPSEGSLFSSRYEAANFSCQCFRAEEIPSKFIRIMLDKINQKASEEFQRNMKRVPFAKLPICVKFKAVFDRDLKDFPSDVEASKLEEFTRLFNTLKQDDDSEALDIFLEYSVMDLLSTNPEKLKSTTQNLISPWRSVQGFSGTPWNIDSFHHSLDVSKTIKRGVDGLTLSTLTSKGGSIARLDTTQKLSAASLIDQDDKSKPPLMAIIDVAAFTKEYTNLENAFEIAIKLIEKGRTDIKGVLYFDDKKNTLHCLKIPEGTTAEEMRALGLAVKNGNEIAEIIEVGGTSPENIEAKTGLTAKDYFTFYDQKRTTGTDIKQRADARALTTISKNTFIRDTLQGVMRLRGLRQGQSTDYVIPQSLDPDSTMDLERLFSINIAAQASQQSRDTIASSPQKLSDALSSKVRATLMEDRFIEWENSLEFSCFTKDLIAEAEKILDSEDRDGTAEERKTKAIVIQVANGKWAIFKMPEGGTKEEKIATIKRKLRERPIDSAHISYVDSMSAPSSLFVQAK
ncbi:MAG: DUF3638 domain-containing protein, partial [Chlamydiales bacterium]|nr:DUF3638 domain-containing protein [Chlamydiales bacterium]